MANQYCIQCGTLLPEDGVCLRCGAVYSFSEDGTLTIHPRKVKKVTAKTSAKKRIFAKRSADPHEADTQTIHIPEDIFSYSDQRVNSDRHIDWTGDEEDYTPNFVIVDEKEEPYSSPVEEADYFEKDDPNVPVPPTTRKKRRGGALFALFLVILLLTSILVFLSIDSSESEKESKTTPSESTTITTAQTTTQKADPVFTASALQLEADMLGNDRVIYEFKEETGRLIINYSGNAEKGVVLLPLIDGIDFTKRHLSLVSLMRHSFWNFENEFCESDFIKNGLIKEIKLNGEGEDGDDVITSYQFSVESGKLLKAYITEAIYHWGTKSYSYYTEVNYSYDANGLVSEISSNTRDSNNEPREYFIDQMIYNEAGFLTEINHKSGWYNDYSDTYKDTLKYSGKLLKSVTPNDEGRPLLSFEYNDKGQLVKVREITHDPHQNTVVVITNTSTGDVKSIYRTGIEAADTYTFSR